MKTLVRSRAARRSEFLARPLAGGLALGVGLALALPGHAQTNGTYFLTNANGQAVDVPGSSTADVQLQQYSLNRTVAQQWTLVDAAASGYKTVRNANSNKACDVNGGATGAAVVQRTANATFDGQQWKFVDVGGGYYKLENKATGLVISARGGTDPATQNQLVIKAYAGANDQKWQLTAVGNGSGTTPPPTTTTPAPTGYTARANYGARNEPTDKVLVGIGQTGADSFSNFVRDANDPAVYPDLYADYVYDLTQSLDDIRVHQVEPFVNRMAQLSSDQHYVALQVGLALNLDSGPVSTTYVDVADGKLDDKLQLVLDAFKKMDRPILVRIGYEFNGGWNHYTDKAAYKRAFVHVAEMIRNQKLDKVATVWCAAAFEGNPDYLPYYPGDQYVDWWGIDLFTTGHLTLPMTAAFLADARAHRKPVVIGEWGLKGDDLPANGTRGGGQALWDLWYKPYFNLIKTNANLKAFVYLNYNLHASFGSNWRDSYLGNDATVMANFKNEIKSPLFAGALTKTDFFRLCNVVTTSQRAAAAAPAETAGLALYPNPSPNGRATLALTAAQAQTATVQVRNAQGELLHTLSTPVPAGRTELALPAGLRPGTYFVQVRLDGQSRRFALKVE